METSPPDVSIDSTVSKQRSSAARRIPTGVRRAVVGWLFVLPALLVYGVFVLQPVGMTVQYSLFEWDGVGPSEFVGLENYGKVIDDPDLIGSIINSFQLLFFFTFIPVGLGIVVASLINRLSGTRFGAFARGVVFLPQIIPLVAAGIIWGLLLSIYGAVNRILELIGLGGVTRAWLGDFSTALPAVGLIGVWVLLGFCTVLLQTGASKINPELYEAARLDGAGWFQELRAVMIPGIRREIGVCITITAIAALASFDIVYVTTGGGPGNTTSVPGIQIYREAFLQRRIGVASALAVMLTLLVLAVVLPIQRFSRSDTST